MNSLDAHKQTSIWARTLAFQSDDPAQESRTRLRSAYESLRRNTSHLVAQINRELPQLTLHDIRHLDALWTTADLIAGPEYSLTPAEAFVFGAAVLLHDAGHALAAIKGGLTALAETAEWRDAAVGILQRSEHPITAGSIKNPPPEIFQDVLFSTVRLLHGRIAETLANLELVNEVTGSRVQLFEDSSLRNHYGAIIGQIAASHNWEIEDLPSRLQNRVGAISGLPNDWTIDPVKLACLLRCADAAQIDQRRAPDFLFALLKLRGMSREHWLAQNKLAQPVRDPDDHRSIIYSSTGPYSEGESEAWWVAFDLVSVVNKELRACNTLLRDSQREEFLVNRVRDVEEPVRLARHVITHGWTPVHAEVQVSNSAGVARMLGGEELYGESPLVPLRELVQNAADSIRARRHYDKSNADFEGRILIRLTSTKTSVGENVRLDVMDDGVGMAQHTLVGPLLDFGTSLWSTRLLESEFPGLRGSAFKPIGRFGIGFYSVFMIADAVSVSSRRFDQGLGQGRTLVFSNGLAARPILLDRLSGSHSSSFQTMVSLTLRHEVGDDYAASNVAATLGSPIVARETITLEDLLRSLCPSLDCDVFFQRGDEATTKIHSRYWYKEDGAQWLDRLFLPRSALNKKHSTAASEAASRLSLIYDGNEVVGRAAISTSHSTYIDPEKPMPDWYRFLDLHVTGHLTYGGLSSDSRHFATATNAFFGVIDGRASRASRFGPPLLLQWNLSDLFQYPEQKQKWIRDQTALLRDRKLTEEQAEALKDNLARFGEIQPGYLNFRIVKLGVTYEKLSDITLRAIAEMGSGLDELEINLPTARSRTGPRFQQLGHFDRRDMKVLSLVLAEMGLQELYFPVTQDKSQIRVPKDLTDIDSFSGILAALTTSLREKDFHLVISAKPIMRPRNMDKQLAKIFEASLDRLITVTATKRS